MTFAEKAILLHLKISGLFTSQLIDSLYTTVRIGTGNSGQLENPGEIDNRNYSLIYNR
jgi:hypothetical protein